jgi:RNA polymerase sigma factor (sigma-70 family)
MPATDPTPSDAEVVVASIDRPAAFATVFDRHHEAIHRFLWSRVGDAADDVAAEVFRVAFERREAYDPSYESAKPWLFGIAANLAREHHRRTTRRRDVRERLVAEGRPEPHPAPEERLARLAATEPVAEAILELPERDREPLLLFAWADLTYDEIAHALDVPLGTVRSRIHRARSQVRANLDHEPADDAGPQEEQR